MMKEKKMQRPELIMISLEAAMKELFVDQRKGCFITLSPGQWDGLLQAAYDDGWILLEIDEVDGVEFPSKAYRKVA